MKTRNTPFSLFAAAMLAIGLITSCKDDAPKDLNVVSILAGTIDLNGATAPTNVPVNPTIVITFTTNVDPATAVAANITMTQDYDGTSIPLTITASGATVTVAPVNALGSGALYRLEVKAGLKSDENVAIAAFTRAFTTAGTFSPSGAIAHWTFEDNSNDVVGPFDPPAANVRNITYVAGRNANAGKAASFNGTTSIIEIPNGDQLIDATNFTVSFWMKTNSTGKTNGHFVWGLAGWNGIQFEVFGNYEGAKFAIQYAHATGSAAEDMWYPALATDNTNGGWQGWSFARSLTAEQMVAKLKDRWIHVVYTYNATSKVGTLYYDGERMKAFDFNLWPAGDAKRGVTGLKYAGNPLDKVLAFGFIQGSGANRTIGDSWADYADPANNHFKGELDDIVFYKKVLSPAEITLMYNSGKP